MLGGSDLDKMITEVVKETLNSTIGTESPSTLDKVIGVKSIQRGVTTVAGNITVSSVNMSKSIVLSVSKGSAGYVAARGSLSGSLTVHNANGTGSLDAFGNYHSNTWPISGSLAGGTTDLTVKQYSAKLINATTLSCDGPVEWQIVEYY